MTIYTIYYERYIGEIVERCIIGTNDVFKVQEVLCRKPGIHQMMFGHTYNTLRGRFITEAVDSFINPSELMYRSSDYAVSVLIDLDTGKWGSEEHSLEKFLE